MSASEADASARVALHAALVDFAESPGKFPVLRREPAILFRSIRDILLLAGGRAMEEAGRIDQAERVRRAASIFIRAAMLREGTDHYTLLGVDRAADEQLVKHHYRLLMRLIHPDFVATHAVMWPSDAATRVNLAYKVLSSPLARREYDEQLEEDSRRMAMQGESGSKMSGGGDPRAMRMPVNGAMADRRDASQRRRLRSVVALCGLAGIALIVYIVSTLDRGHQVYLVQRNAVSTDATVKRPVPTEPNPELVALQSMLPDDRASPLGAVSATPQLGRTQSARDKAPGESQVPAKAIAPVPRPSVPTGARTEGVIKAAKRDTPKVAASNSTGADGAKTDEHESTVESAPASEVPISNAKAPAPLARNAVSMPGTGKSAAAIEQHGEGSLVLRATARADMGGQGGGSKDRVIIPAVTVAEMQPVLNNLLQQLESGRGVNLLAVMDKDARKEPSALAFVSYYDAFVGGARAVRLSQVDLKPETGTGRLQMAGFVRVDLLDEEPRSKRLALRVEFGSRGGAVVVTRLTGSEVMDR